MEFSPSVVPDLTSQQRDKLIKLVGPRYNPSKDIVHMSCESFPDQAQNKRYLGDLVEKLIREAKDGHDTFEDVPFDFRHHTPKVFHKFPENWIITPERRAQLLAKHKEASEAEKIRMETGRVIDGMLFIPGGPEQRRQETLIKEQIKRENDIIYAPKNLFRDEEKKSKVVIKEEDPVYEKAVSQRNERLLKERMEYLAEARSRRPTRRLPMTRKHAEIEARQNDELQKTLKAHQVAARAVPEVRATL